MRYVKCGGLPRLAAGLVLVLLTGALFAGGTSRKEVEKELFNTLRNVINHGADLFNEPRNDHAGCYRLFEGALTSIRPVLVHYPELQKSIDAALAKAKNEHPVQGAFTLRAALDQVRATLKKSFTAPAKPDPMAKILWDRLGGEEVVVQIVDEFFTTASADPKVNMDRSGKHPVDPKKFKKLLVEQISSITGGPYQYTGKQMKDAHKGMKITEAEFNATADHLKKALEKFQVASADVNAVMQEFGKLKKDIVEPPVVVVPPKKALWERLGELAGAKKIANAYLLNVLTDPKVDFDRKGRYLINKDLFTEDLTALISKAAEGPLARGVHLGGPGVGLTALQKEAAAASFKKTLQDLKIADADATELSSKIDANLRQFVDAKHYRTELKGEEKKVKEKKKVEEKKTVEEAKTPAEPGRVSGRVLVNGKPANIGYVLFVNEATKKVYGTYIAGDGSYGFKTDIPSGKYLVAVQPANDPRTDKPLPNAVPIPARYANPATSGLRLNVQPGNNSLTLDLKN